MKCVTMALEALGTYSLTFLPVYVFYVIHLAKDVNSRLSAAAVMSAPSYLASPPHLLLLPLEMMPEHSYFCMLFLIISTKKV